MGHRVFLNVNNSAKKYQVVSERHGRDELIHAHLPLVKHIVGRLLAHLPSGLDVENLESAGTLGLVEAAGKFDAERGVKFETFASWRIRGAVLDELRRNCPLPQDLLERMARVRQAYQELPAPVSLEMLSEVTGLTPDEVNDCLAAMRMTRMVSWESLSESRQAQTLTERPDDEAESEDQKQLLAQGISQLPERERLVVTLYYREDLRLKEIGNVLKLSESRVSRLLSASLYSLGEFMRTHGEA